MAINLDGYAPLWCKCFHTDENSVHLHSLTATIDGFLSHGISCEQYDEEIAVCTNLEDFFSPDLFSRSTESIPPSCVLLRACIVVSKLFSNNQDISLADQIERFGGGIKIVSCSKIPSGSGMGGSSILAAVILKCLFNHFSPALPLDEEMLVFMVGQVEQLLTTGGGWQDQVGGIYPGFKLCRSNGTLETTISVEKYHVSHEFIQEFSRRTVLIYSGIQVILICLHCFTA